MENFKVSVDVNVKFSEETLKAIASIFAGIKPTTSVAPAAPAAPAAPVAQVVSAAPAAKQSSNTDVAVSIDEVRAALAKKVNAHRDEIKNKLNELGSPSVTKLDSSKYREMLDFLNSLD